MNFPPIRIAILECDTPQPATHAKYGGFGGLFSALFNAAADTLSTTKSPTGCPPHPTHFSRSDLQFSIFDVVKQECPDLKDIDAIVISGARNSAYDDDPWILKLVEFVRTILETQARVRVIGVCFGHQVVGRAVGGVVSRGERWEVSVEDLMLTERGREIFGRSSLACHQMHHDIVATVPQNSNIQILGSTSRCAIQSMYLPRKLFTIQGHPEFDGEIAREILDVRHDGKIFDDETFGEAIERVDNHQDGILIAQAFLRFLLEA